MIEGDSRTFCDVIGGVFGPPPPHSASDPFVWMGDSDDAKAPFKVGKVQIRADTHVHIHTHPHTDTLAHTHSHSYEMLVTLVW